MPKILTKKFIFMVKLNKISSSLWDFTLYKNSDGNYVIKVMFSEGEYKVDVARFFVFHENEIKNPQQINEVKVFSEEIRDNYVLYLQREISKIDFDEMLDK